MGFKYDPSIPLDEWYAGRVKITLLVTEQEEIMERCKLYDYDNKDAMKVASLGVKSQYENDLIRMHMILGEVKAICWRLGIVED